MKTIYIDNNGQVMATYSGKCDSAEWDKLGYIKHELEDGQSLPSRNEIVSVVDNKLTDRTLSINPVKPEETSYSPTKFEILMEVLNITQQQYEEAKTRLIQKHNT